MHYPSSENKGADQLRSYREADLRLCFRLCRLLVFPWGGSFFNSLCGIFFQIQDNCLADCHFLHDKTQFCRTVQYIIIWVIFAGHSSNTIKYFVRQNEILLVLPDRPALFAKTVLMRNNFSPHFFISTQNASMVNLKSILTSFFCVITHCSIFFFNLWLSEQFGLAKFTKETQNLQPCRY